MLANILTEEEIKIYNLVKEYTIRKPFISIQDILPFLSQRLRRDPNFTSYRIEIILKKLIKGNLILPKMKLVKEQILTLPKRAKIFDYILTNPGINVNQLITRLNMGSNEVLWHLNILEKFHFIRKKLIQNQRVFFNFNLDSMYDKLFYYFNNNKAQNIIKILVNSNSALELTKIAELTKMHYNTTKKYIKILSDMKLITISNKDKKRLFTLDRNYYYDIVRLIETKKKEML